MNKKKPNYKNYDYEIKQKFSRILSNFYYFSKEENYLIDIKDLTGTILRKEV